MRVIQSLWVLSLVLLGPVSVSLAADTTTDTQSSTHKAPEEAKRSETGKQIQAAKDQVAKVQQHAEEEEEYADEFADEEGEGEE